MDNFIPQTSPVYKILANAAQSARVVVFSGLPGTGKSLYVNQFQNLAEQAKRPITVIQWDVARKAFETEFINSHFPMGEGTVHNGLKLSVGLWLLDTIKDWNAQNASSEELLLIEAPLVGHRFVEIAKKQEDPELEDLFCSTQFQVIVPIPSKAVREKIEAARMAQVSEDAKVWMGAKPSVMLMIWKMICGVANQLGKEISMEGQPPYDPEIYQFVFAEILKHRNYIPMFVDEVFQVEVADEKELHDTGSLSANESTANVYVTKILDAFKTEEAIDNIVEDWFRS